MYNRKQQDMQKIKEHEEEGTMTTRGVFLSKPLLNVSPAGTEEAFVHRKKVNIKTIYK